ncbi:AAA family ATPase [Kitasatospora acidiphila]|uniref:AAA family ATPase n=1 Tax=Kitasatospora acidiphila TaxID=2567942 RepID=UPI003C793509
MSAWETVMSAIREQHLPLRARHGSARTQGICHGGDAPDTVAIAMGRDKQVLIHCHKGCSTDEFLRSIGLKLGDLYDGPKGGPGQRSVVKSYPYFDAAGTLVYYVDRYVPKDFRPRMADGSKGFPKEKRLLYNLPQVRAEVDAHGTIWLCEGEKDADNLTSTAGVVATTMPGGTGMGWLDSYTAHLVGAEEVVVLADRDQQGVAHARKVAASLSRRSIPHRIMLGAAGKDISDHLAAGLGGEELITLEEFEREPDPARQGSDPVDASEADGPTRQIVLTPASKIKIRPVRWLWDTTPPGASPTSHGRIPMYSLAIAAGGPGLGKSQWVVWLTSQITRGTLPGELFGKPRSVIYAATEDSWTYTIAPRLVAAGADLDRVFRIDVVDDEKLSARLTLPSDISLLGKAAEEYNVALFVADPLLSLIDSSINDYRAAEVRAALEPLVACAERHRFTIVGLAHFTKAGGADPVNRISGSGAFGQLIRSLIAFAQQENEDGDTEFVMSLEKNNLGRLGLPSFKYVIQPMTVETEEGPSYVSRFVLGGHSETSVREALRIDGNFGTSRSELNEAAAWLRDYLQDPKQAGEAPPKEIEKAAREAGLTPNALREAKAKLGVKSVKPTGAWQSQWVWRLPEQRAESVGAASP